MPVPPSDGLGDGTRAKPFTIQLDVTTLTQQQCEEYRRDLIHAVYHPGTEYDMVGNQSIVDEAAFLAQIRNCDAFLKTFAEKI